MVIMRSSWRAVTYGVLPGIDTGSSPVQCFH